MDPNWQSGGYGNMPRSSEGNNDFGSDFISFGSDNSQDQSYNQRRRGRGRAPQLQRISGTQRSHKSFGEGDQHYEPESQYNLNMRGGSNHRGYNQPFHPRRGGHFRDSGFGFRDRGFGFRGNRGHGHGPRYPRANDDISSYFHPSMVEDPWRELEARLQTPQNESASNSLPSEPKDNLEEQSGPMDSDQSLTGEDSE